MTTTTRTVTVTVLKQARQRIVETRNTRTGNRVNKGCFESNATRLAVDLRKLFDDF